MRDSYKRNSHRISTDFSTPSTSKLRRKKNELLPTMIDDINEEEYPHLFSSGINIDDFEVKKVIGRGTYAKIYLVKKYLENYN